MTILLMVSCGTHPHGNAPFTIDGELTGVPDSVVLTLYKGPKGDDVLKAIAMDTLKDGRFHFTAEADSSYSYFMSARYKENIKPMPIHLFPEPGCKIAVKGTGYFTATWDVKSKVKAQKDHRKLREMTKEEMKTYDSITSYKDHLNYYLENVSPKKLAWLKKTRITDAWFMELESYTNTALHFRRQDMIAEAKALYKSIPNESKTDPWVEKIARLLAEASTLPGIDEKLGVGDFFPSKLIFYDKDGAKHTLKEHEGTTRLLYFSSKGCGPCKLAKPELEEIDANENLDVKIIEVSIDDYPAWENETKENPSTWIQYNDHRKANGAFSFFDAIGIPLFVLISKDGEILDLHCGYSRGKVSKMISGK